MADRRANQHDDRYQIEKLEQTLRGAEGRNEAFDLVRSLIHSVVITPTAHGSEIELRGDLAGILAISSAAKGGLYDPAEKALQIKLVAGAGFEPTTFRL